MSSPEVLAPAATPREPSSSQWSFLRALGRQRTSGSLCLQLNWRWADGEYPATEMAAVHQKLTALGGEVFSEARNNFLLVGTGEANWHTLCLWRLPQPAAVELLLRSQAFRQVNARAVGLSALLMREAGLRMRGTLLFGRYFWPLMPRPRVHRGMHQTATGPLYPNAQQHHVLATADQTQPTQMFSFLKYNRDARYADGSRGRTGEQAYTRYYGPWGVIAVLLWRGRFVAKGAYLMTLISPDGDPAPERWDESHLMAFPNRMAYQNMMDNRFYHRMLEHRNAGLAATQVWSITPLPPSLAAPARH